MRSISHYQVVLLFFINHEKKISYDKLRDIFIEMNILEQKEVPIKYFYNGIYILKKSGYILSEYKKNTKLFVELSLTQAGKSTLEFFISHLDIKKAPLIQKYLGIDTYLKKKQSD